MSEPSVDDHCGLVGDPPVEVQVTVRSAPRRPTARERIGQVGALRRVHVVLAAVLGAVVTASVIAAAASTGGGGGTIREAGAARRPGPAGVAAAYGYPLRCLRVTIALHDPRFARADFDRALECGRFTGDPTAIFERVQGRWRPRLDAIGYACPVRSLPPPVQVQLGVCP